MALLLSAGFIGDAQFKMSGIGFAVASGAIASGLGYAVWYMALPHLRAATAATVQLCVPVLAAIGGVVFLAEPVTLRLEVASFAILGGVAVFMMSKPKDIGAQGCAAKDI
jgi:drug/metabolite transporter (DMT)-like permease